MRRRWVASVVLTVWATVACGAGRAGAVDPGAAGVLDRLAVPAVPALATGAEDGRTVQPPLSADPIAVPTPTAATSGLVLLAGLMAWRVARRAVVGRA